MRRQRYEVRMRRKSDGSEITKSVFAASDAVARVQAPDLAKRGLKTMADRRYAEFEVISCTRAAILLSPQR